jgi:hypothetical protein
MKKMSLQTIIFIVGLLAIIFGVKNPWFGGLAGLIVFLLLFYVDISTNIILLIVVTPIGFLFSLATAFASSIISSGLKSKGNMTCSSYMSGFGVHHPGGIICSVKNGKEIKIVSAAW